MPCFSPLRAWYGKTRGRTGKRLLVFNRNKASRLTVDSPVILPCGQCVGCRLERARQWAIRCKHEADMFDLNAFITLTFDDDHLPDDMSVSKRDWQLFMKRLRKRFGVRIRFFACGEYGEDLGRPHYHALLFNFDFPDKTFWKLNNGYRLYRSAALENLWPFGFSSIGAVTFDSSGYVARYIMKKLNGKDADAYDWIDWTTGVIHSRSPEFVLMSRRPGIGKLWFDKFGSDVFPRDEVVVNSLSVRPPKYYDALFEAVDEDTLADIKSARMDRAREHAEDQTPDRRRVREKVMLEATSRLVRPLE